MGMSFLFVLLYREGEEGKGGGVSITSKYQQSINISVLLYILVVPCDNPLPPTPLHPFL